MPRAEHSDAPSTDRERPSLPEGTEHVVVVDPTGGPSQAAAPEIRVPATRLEQYDDVDLSEYVGEDEDPGNVTVLFEPGDELPIPVAADGTYRAHNDRLAAFDADGERLDRAGRGNTEDGVRQWQAGQ